MMRQLLLCMVVLPLVATAAAQQTSKDWTLEQLMQLRAQEKSGSARFVQVRKSAATELSTTTTGTLSYEAPGRLERRTAPPFPETAIVENDRLTITRETLTGQVVRKEFALAELPGLRPFFVALRAVLTGDADTLKSDFKVSLTGSEDKWRLKLVPRGKAGTHVPEILVSGRSGEVLVIEVFEQTGDSTHTALKPEAREPKPPAPAQTPTPGS